MPDLCFGQRGVQRQPHHGAVARSGRGAEHRAEHAARFEVVAQHQGVGLGAGLQRDDLLAAMPHRVAQRQQLGPHPPAHRLQALAFAVGRHDHVQRGVERGHLVRQQAGAEDVVVAGAHDVVAQPGRDVEETGPAGEGLGQAGGDEVHPVADAQRPAQAGAARAVGAQRVRLVHQDHAAGGFRGGDDLHQRRHRAGGAVDRVHDHQARAVALHQALQVGHVVVAEGVGRRLGPARTLPKRHVGQHVDVDRCPVVGDALQQPHVGRIARLAEHAVVLADPARHALLERAHRVRFEQEGARLDDELAVAADRGALRLHDVRMPGDVEVVVAVEPHRVGPRVQPVHQRPAAPDAVPALDEIALDAVAQVRGVGGVDRGVDALDFQHFHGDLL